MMFMILAVPVNIINAIMGDKSHFTKFHGLFPFNTLTKKTCSRKKNSIITAMDINIDRIGNSAGEKGEIVIKIKNPPFIVAFKVTKPF